MTMDDADLEKLARSCVDVALKIKGYHPYMVANEMGSALGQGIDAEKMCYEIKKHIFDTVDPKTVIWELPEPRKPSCLVGII